jgi:hypothetical protein
MKNITTLLKTWSLPDRTQERSQLTVRINYDLYAKLQALKEVYPTRSVNDLVTDIIQAGVDEIIQALPIHIRTFSREEAEEASYQTEQPVSDFLDAKTSSGPGVEFQYAYSRILAQKTESESKNEEAA